MGHQAHLPETSACEACAPSRPFAAPSSFLASRMFPVGALCSNTLERTKLVSAWGTTCLEKEKKQKDTPRGTPQETPHETPRGAQVLDKFYRVTP